MSGLVSKTLTYEKDFIILEGVSNIDSKYTVQLLIQVQVKSIHGSDKVFS